MVVHRHPVAKKRKYSPEHVNIPARVPLEALRQVMIGQDRKSILQTAKRAQILAGNLSNDEQQYKDKLFLRGGPSAQNRPKVDSTPRRADTLV